MAAARWHACLVGRIAERPAEHRDGTAPESGLRIGQRATAGQGMANEGMLSVVDCKRAKPVPAKYPAGGPEPEAQDVAGLIKAALPGVVSISVVLSGGQGAGTVPDADAPAAGGIVDRAEAR